MGRAPCCDKANVKRGPWSPEEDAILRDYMNKFGSCTNWIALPNKAGLKRCGKSCRLRWLNYLRPNIKHGEFSDDEDRVICTLYATIGSRWSIIAAQLPGRTDNDIKNYWNTKLKKKLMGMINIPQQQPSLYHNFITTTTNSQFLPPLMNNIINSTITTTTTPDNNYMQPPPYFLNETNTSLLANTTSQLQHSSFSSSFLGNFGNTDQVMMMMMNLNGNGSTSDNNREQIKQEDQTLLFHGYTKSNNIALSGNNINAAGDKLLNDDAVLLEDVKKLICSGLMDQDQMIKSIHGDTDEEKNIHYFW